MKDHSLLRALRIGVVIFERAEKGQIRIAAKSAAIGAFVYRAEPRDKLIIGQIKSSSCIDYFFVSQIIKLRAQYFAHGRANFDESANPARGFVWQIEDWRQCCTRADRDTAVVQREGV